MRWWPFRKHRHDDRDRKLATAMSERLDRQQPEVERLARDLRAHRRRNSFREKFDRTLHGEV